MPKKISYANCVTIATVSIVNPVIIAPCTIAEIMNMFPQTLIDDISFHASIFFINIFY
jgi:hypothetical protein